MEDLINKLIKKYEGIVKTLEHNREVNKNNPSDKYPYGMDIEFSEKVIVELKSIIGQTL